MESTRQPAFKIGAQADASSGFWDGQIDEVRVIARALSQAEIQDLMYPDEVYSQIEQTVSTKYYFAGGRLAMRTNGTLHYLLSDHLGSTSVTADANGAFVSEMRYMPWGETRYMSGTVRTDYLYTGQRRDDIGLYYYRARWYDSALGRFVQADTIVPDPGNPMAFDRYAYVYNNPVKYNDPSGHGGGDMIGWVHGPRISIDTEIFTAVSVRMDLLPDPSPISPPSPATPTSPFKTSEPSTTPSTTPSFSSPTVIPSATSVLDLPTQTMAPVSPSGTPEIPVTPREDQYSVDQPAIRILTENTLDLAKAAWDRYDVTKSGPFIPADGDPFAPFDRAGWRYRIVTGFNAFYWLADNVHKIQEGWDFSIYKLFYGPEPRYPGNDAPIE